MGAPFVPGIELGRRLYVETVRPLLDRHLPGLVHSAGLLGHGSEVLGFDTEMSTDHDWGPRVQLFLPEDDRELCPAIVELAADHRVVATTVAEFVRELLGWDVGAPSEPADWLTFPSQSLLSLTAGAVYEDGTGELGRLRERLAWYPHDVWLYLLASGWRRIAQEEHLMPRAGFVGDELGSALIGSRLVRDLMALCFLIERRYAPYPKWFGSAFQRLRSAPEVGPLLMRAQRAAEWREREAALCDAYEAVARLHNGLGLTEEITPRVSSFHDRPFRVIGGDRFAEALAATIHDPAVRVAAERRLIGGIDQFSDSTDLRAGPEWRPVLGSLYRPIRDVSHQPAEP
jgi:Domain of unknown function (DUF4037)